MAVTLHNGVYSAALGLAGAGAVMLWPNAQWIGWVLLTVAAGLLLWGLQISGSHCWEWRPNFQKSAWWDGRRSFSIERAACLMAGVEPRKFAQNDYAQAIADELVGLVRGGHLPLDQESSIYSDDELGYIDFPDGTPFWKNKPGAGKDAIISRRQVELFAKRNRYNLPWQTR